MLNIRTMVHSVLISEYELHYLLQIMHSLIITKLTQFEYSFQSIIVLQIKHQAIHVLTISCTTTVFHAHLENCSQEGG